MSKNINDKSPVRVAILEEVFSAFASDFQYVDIKRFRIKHRAHLQVIDEMVAGGILREEEGRYEFHLRAYVESKWWDQEKGVLNTVFLVLQRLYADNPDGQYKCEDVISNLLLIDNKRLLPPEVERAVLLLDRLGFIGGGTLANNGVPRVHISFAIREKVLRYNSIDEVISEGMRNGAHVLTYPEKGPRVGQSFLQGIGRSLAPSSADGMQQVNISEDGAFETISSTYTRMALIGEGGAGKVYKTKSMEGDEYALKYLPPDKVTAEKTKRFKNEMFFCERNKHPNILRVLDYGFKLVDGKKCPFYVMPIYESTLRKLINVGIAKDKVLQYFSQLLDGVEAAHLQNVCHRDVKPENILLDVKEDRLLLADFGIAQFEEEHLWTVVETVPGTRLANFQYAAPEQRKKGTGVDSRADIYALGLILNEMFTGEVPQGAGYKTITGVAPDFAYLDDIVSKMIQQDPESRPRTINDVKNMLIAQKNVFVAAQKLDENSKEVVTTSNPGTVAPVSIVGVDYQKGILVLELNRAPEPGWVQLFQYPRESFSSLMSTGPNSFRFDGKMCSVPSNERDAQALIEFFKQYSEKATRCYQRDLIENAKREEADRRRRLEAEAKEAKIRLDLLKNIKI